MDFIDDDRYGAFTREENRFFPLVYSIDKGLPQQPMPTEMYVLYGKWHEQNSKRLKASRKKFIIWPEVKIECPKIGYCMSEELRDFPYATSTLGKSGCAPFCIAQALSIPVEKVATELATKGYYREGRGTWRMALNRLGAKECSDIREIAEALKNKRIVTILGNGHFRNIVGVFQEYFVIADSSYDKLRFEPIEVALENTSSAWRW